MKFKSEMTGNVLETENPTVIVMMQASQLYTAVSDKEKGNPKKEKK